MLAPSRIVSIHARPIGRAMPFAAHSWRSLHPFQSTPGQLAGRCMARDRADLAQLRFNPRPANWPGDAGHGHVRTRRSSRFQSTPGQLAGRCTMPSADSAGELLVSIHARPIGRAMPTVRALHPPCAAGFNPRPANWPGDALADMARLQLRIGLFQSTPGQLAGRCVEPIRRLSARHGVSIHARPIGRAMPWVGPIGRVELSFQSTPGQLAGRCPGRRHPGPRLQQRFNPRPANWPGDARAAPAL